jgi:REP element-mobilizing transposase RayT
LRRALERLAAANACVLTHTLVRPELVHLVVTCPPGRDSAWAAYLFKNGSEQVIQQQFGVAATLWDKGFYAVESADPLATAELNIFLEHNMRDA